MHDDAPFAVLDPEFFVSFDRWTPGPEFRAAAAALLPADDWRVIAEGVWTHVHPHGWRAREQGWKLHVSTLPQGAEEVLRRVAAVLRDDPTAFKFASDHRILSLLHSKNWGRVGGGKFITIYPGDDEQFQRLAGSLTRATEGFDGPYIFSDRRVPGSRIVFYRYGEHAPLATVRLQGHREHGLRSPAGETVSDGRRGYYELPDWVEDPYGAHPVQVLARVGDDGDGAPRVTLRDRYRVKGAIKYTNVGGIYVGTDLERDEPVVIRERRPYTGWIGPHTDSVALLRQEARILRMMDGTGWTPRFVDEFGVWEHHYVVMEKVPAITLRDFAATRYHVRGKTASPRRLFWTFRHVILELVRGIEAFHERGVIIRDLTANNVLVRRDRSLCFIDLEFAWERSGGEEPALSVATPGFASPAQEGGAFPTEADDYYSLGAVIVEMCSFMAGGLALHPAGMLASARAMLDEVGLPRQLVEVAEHLLDPDPATRWGAAQVRSALAAVRPSAIPWAPAEPGRRVEPAPRPPEALTAEAASVCEEVCRFFEAAAEPGQPDCLWPAPPAVYRTNPVSVQLGACGPLEYVRRVRGACPDAWLDWVERRADPRECPPGLYMGTSGVALTLAACGRGDAARRLLRAAVDSPLLAESPDLYHGAAGVGVAALALAAELGDDAAREAAARVGRDLLERSHEARGGLAWRHPGGVIPCGLAAGGCGIALFYTYLGACAGDERHWEVARRALAYEFTHARRHGGYYAFPDRAGRGRRYWSPHVSFGSAGVAAAALRLYRCTRDPELLEWAERCADALTLRRTNKLWQDMGFAGWGETLLDMYAATGDGRWLAHAARVAEVILPTRLRTRFGVAFPGASLSRVTSDFAMGTSGIALFLHRLAHGGLRAFFPDHLLPGWPASPSWATVPAPDGEVSAPAVRGTSDAAAAPRREGRALPRAGARTLA